MDLKLKKILYITQLMAHKRKPSSSSFESLLRPDITKHLSVMLAPPLIEEDLYFCETTEDQKEVEDAVKEIYMNLIDPESEIFDKVLEGLVPKVTQLKDTVGVDDDTKRELKCVDKEFNYELHLRYIEHFLSTPLPSGFSALDCNHGWMVYWLLNAHALLQDGEIPQGLKEAVSAKIGLLLVDNGAGGIAGGPGGQIGHAASTYASVLALVLVQDFETLNRIKPNLYRWFLSLKSDNGSYFMHEGGESDARSTYCVLSVAALLNMVTDDLLKGCKEFLLACQTYEGGFAGTPYTEAHGGYTFCALAALYVTPGKFEGVNTDSLLRWLGARQLHLEGGFSGRSNKLVDACYSFWIGAPFALLESSLGYKLLFNRAALKSYILNCCQDEKHGGLRDKPGKNPDFYHTNYTLCGQSVAEHTFEPEGLLNFKASECIEGASITSEVNPVFGLPISLVAKCLEFFY